MKKRVFYRYATAAGQLLITWSLLYSLYKEIPWIRSSLFTDDYLQVYKTLQLLTSLFTEITNIYKHTQIY